MITLVVDWTRLHNPIEIEKNKRRAQVEKKIILLVFSPTDALYGLLIRNPVANFSFGININNSINEKPHSVDLVCLHPVRCYYPCSSLSVGALAERTTITYFRSEGTYMALGRTISTGKAVAPERQEWRTPPDLFARLNEIFRFTVDACASRGNHLLPRWWGYCQDKDWTGEVAFVNPPFGDASPVIAKAATAKLSVVLLPITSLCTGYTDDNPPAYFVLPRRRIKFLPPPGVSRSGQPPLATVIMVYGQLTDDQVEKLERIGKVFRKPPGGRVPPGLGWTYFQGKMRLVPTDFYDDEANRRVADDEAWGAHEEEQLLEQRRRDLCQHRNAC